MVRIPYDGLPKSPYRRGLTYPQFFPRTGDKRRKRTFAWMTVSHKHNAVEVLDEHGETFRFGINEYEAVRDMAISHGWCLFAKFGLAIAGRYPFLRNTLHDERATILASPRKVGRSGTAVVGIEWRRGNKRAKVVDPDSWGFSNLVREKVYVSPISFLLYCRKCCDLLGVGDYDTPAALGAAKLASTWQSSGLRKLWLLPRQLRTLLESNGVHPRIYDIDTPARYPLLRERDRRSAYASTLAGDLPLNQPCYISASEATSDLVRDGTSTGAPSQSVSETGILFGLWEVTVPEDIAYGPVRRVWAPGEGASFHIKQGVYQVPLWGEEADALAEIGCSCTWRGGYLWLDRGSPWKRMVDDINRLRAWADDTRRPILSEMLKRVPNAVVGRFHCLTRCEIVEESRAVEGDAIFPLDWDGESEPEECVALHVSESNDCVPEHWYSYIVMKVGLSIWRAEREEIKQGYTVVSANIDSYRVVQPTLQHEATLHPLQWKEFLIRDARIDASRHIDGWKSSDGGLTWQRMIRAPGVRRE